MREFHKIWIEQCDAARDIREAFGLQKALGYLIGEKFIDFLRTADHDPAFAGEVPHFAAAITEIFDRAEIRTYLNTVRRVGPLGHVATDEAYDELREAGAVPDDPGLVGRRDPPRGTGKGASARLNRLQGEQHR